MRNKIDRQTNQFNMFLWLFNQDNLVSVAEIIYMSIQFLRNFTNVHSIKQDESDIWKQYLTQKIQSKIQRIYNRTQIIMCVLDFYDQQKQKELSEKIIIVFTVKIQLFE
ncbi:unnamed protein product [Paramecium sonneborni]|uniref:Uncharacterized protein n=1 Tax=Paramecium sonneborni TaxID=65129 RepID=A0A8S1P274_9CILI|nr:unnamed protein product [Paramecium sonneborni]